MSQSNTHNPLAAVLHPPEAELDAFRVQLDLNHTLAAYRHGPITVWMTWVRTIERWEPCIALTRPNLFDLEGGKAVPCVVPLNRAYAWVSGLQAKELQGQLPASLLADLRDVMTTAAEWAFTLGLNGMKSKDVMKVLNAVDDHLSELISMPPRPAGLGETRVADMIVTDANSGKTWEMEVHDVQ